MAVPVMSVMTCEVIHEFPDGGLSLSVPDIIRGPLHSGSADLVDVFMARENSVTESAPCDDTDLNLVPT